MKRYLRYVLPVGGSFLAMAAFAFQGVAAPVQRPGMEPVGTGSLPGVLFAVAGQAPVIPSPAGSLMFTAEGSKPGAGPAAVMPSSTGALGDALLTFVGLHPGTTPAAAMPCSGSPTVVSRNPVADTAAPPPPTWQEHWFEHRQEMRRVFSNASISVYYDKETPETITWPDTLLTKVWNYTTRTYGAFGKDNRLFVLLHTGKYAGGHPSTYFDASHDNRNVIDVGHAGDWVSPTGWNLDAAVHEVGHIVEGASKGVHGSPAFPIWKDSKWMEIYQYDVYCALGWDTEAQRWFDMQMKGSDNFPRPGTQWFKNWFYPIYKQYGGAKVLNNFFTLLAANFTRNGNAYTRDMNWGEFIHFWSGAAGVNLKPQATIAFGWPDEWETQFLQAQKDFPGVKYK